VLRTLSLAFVDGAIVVGMSMIGYTLAPRYITAAEVTIICLLEPLVSPVIVWVGVGQVPGTATVGVGAVFICGLAAHERAAMVEGNGDGDGGGSGSGSGSGSEGKGEREITDKEDNAI